jgi:cysteine desulfurase
MEKQVYLDNAATTPLDTRVLEKMTPYLTDIFGNADSPHAVGRKAMRAVDCARDKVAELICAHQNEVYFTCGGTEADNWAVIGSVLANATATRRKIVCSPIEHHAVLSAMERLQKYGFEIVWLPVNEGGRVELNALKDAIDEDTVLVCLMLANNETGVLQPVKEGVKIAHEKGALFFTDAVQYAPYMPIDVKEIGADLLSFSAHKFNGPKGVGVLYIKNGVKMEKLVGGGEQERGMRGGTLNVASIVGLAEAYALTRAEMDQNNEKLQRLSAIFLRQLDALSGIARNGDKDCALPSVLNLHIDGVENTALLYKTDLLGLCFAAGSACASASVKPSHVLTAMGFDEKKAKESVRISFGKCNTEGDALQGAKIFIKAVEELRKF